MPTEVRHIFFQTAEIGQAVQELRRRTGKPIPPGSVISCAVEDDVGGRDMRFIMRVQPDKEGSAEIQVCAAKAEIAAAVILLCRTLKIPLPVRASKNIELIGGKLGLICTKHPVDYEDLSGPLRAN